MTRLLALAALCALAACAPDAEKEASAAVSPPAPQFGEKAPAGTMPFAARGTFLETADGASDPADCSAPGDADKLITVDETGYALGNRSGRLAAVETQSTNSIYATFDTDEGEARERFAASDEGRTLRRSTIGPEAVTTRYRRCPDA